MVQTAGRGLASGSLDELAERVIAAWDSFIELAEAVDLDAPTRLPRWRGREVLVHLGTWDDHSPLVGAIASAQEGATGRPYDADAGNAAVVAAHADATRDEILAALGRSRDGIAELGRRKEWKRLATAPAMSSLGPLPLAGLVHAGCYELAVHALDLAPAGAPAPDRELLDAGLGALIDVTGGLAARHSIELSVAAQTPDGGWRTEIGDDAWSTHRTDPGPVEGPAVLGSAIDILDASAGRAPAPVLLVQRRLVVQDMSQFLRLAPLVREVPGIPGSAVLRRAASAFSGVAGLLSRFRSP